MLIPLRFLWLTLLAEPARRMLGSLLLAASLSLESGVVYAQATCKQILGNQEKMKLIEEINLPNGLKLNIFDLSREIAANTVKVEIAFKTDVDLKEAFFSNKPDYQQVKNIFGDKLNYEYKMERAYVRKDQYDAVREALITTFKNNSLHYLGSENFAEKLAISMLRDIKNNSYKYRSKEDNEK